MFLPDVMVCFLQWVYSFCWKEGEGKQLDLTGQKEAHSVQTGAGGSLLCMTSICKTSHLTLCLVLFLYDCELLPPQSSPIHSFHNQNIKFVKILICRFNLKKCLGSREYKFCEVYLNISIFGFLCCSSGEYDRSSRRTPGAQEEIFDCKRDDTQSPEN